MKFTSLLSTIGLCGLLLFFANCSEEPIQSDLSNISQSIDTLLITSSDITAFNYQVSPDIGGYNKLYVGNQDGFNFTSSLLKFSTIGWNTFIDSTVTVDSLFFKVFAGDSSLSIDNNLKLYFSNDSVFDENNSSLADLSNIDFSSWSNLGSPAIDVIIDTSDTVSQFQETSLSWNLSSISESLIDTTKLYRTFALSYGADESFIELFSREYSSGSLDPKIEVYYRSEVDLSSDSTIIDTLTRLVYVSEDLSILKDVENAINVDNSIFISRARGYRSVFNIPFDSLSLPPYSVIRYANLSLYQKENTNDTLKSFSVRMEPLKVEIDTSSQVFELDPYDYLGQHYSSATTASGKLEISLKSYFQSILMTDSIKNVGFKLYSNMSNDLFDSLSFDLDNVNNRLEIFYVAP
ncbi:hypothetical protein OAV77_00665 [Candidatus Marinimicrobia bacterium]|nr:hypothetical protein [Candidatus Neomarinimicrobiota bacterium]